MIYYLSDPTTAKIVVDCEYFTNEDGHFDVSMHIDIDGYTDLLLKNIADYQTVVKHFSELQELRGWLFEWRADKAEFDYDTVKLEIEDMLKDTASRYGLHYRSD